MSFEVDASRSLHNHNLIYRLSRDTGMMRPFNFPECNLIARVPVSYDHCNACTVGPVLYFNYYPALEDFDTLLQWLCNWWVWQFTSNGLFSLCEAVATGEGRHAGQWVTAYSSVKLTSRPTIIRTYITDFKTSRASNTAFTQHFFSYAC